MSGLARLWRLLTEAPTAVSESARRRQIQLLSGLLVVLILLVLLLIGLQLLLFPGFWPTFVAVASALVVLLLAYGLTRVGKFTAGALLTVGTSSLTCFAVVVLNPHDPIVYAFLNVSMFLARLLFDKTGVWITTLANLLGVTLLLPVFGVPPPGNDPVVVPIFLIITAALLLLGARYRDAVERDRQMELVASEARFRDFADATLEGVVFTENGSIIDINERGAALVGATSSAALVGRDILDFCAPADRERVAALMRNNVTTPYEFTIRRVDGSEFPGVVRGRTSLYHNRPVRVTVFRDLTERRHAEEELRREREFTSTVLDTAGSLIVVLDRAGRIVRFNRTAEELTGYRFDEVRGQTPWDYFLSPDESAAVETVFKRLTANDVVARYENHWRMRDGSYRLFDWSNRVITGSAGAVEYIVSVGVDISERKRAEQALCDSEAMLARAQEMTHLGSWTWQVASGQVTWSDEMYRIYGVSPDAGEVSFERAMAAIHPDDRAFVAQQVQDMLASRQTDTYECRIVRPDGVERNVWARSEVQRAADGSPQFVIGTVQDITGRKRAEQALHDSEARLRAVVSNAPVVLYILDRDGVILLSEGRGLAVLQLKPGEVVGRSVFEMYRDYPEIVSTIRRALAGEAVVHTATLGPLTFEVHYTPTFGPDGRVETVLGLAIDISARKQAENALIQSESNFRALTENANVGILVNHRGKHVFANNRLLDMLGYTADEIRDTGAKELVHPQEYDKVMERIRERMEGQPTPGEYETVFMTKTGQAVPVELTAAKTTWQGEPAGLVFLHDISERLRTEEQMRKLSSALEQTADAVVITDRNGVIEYVNPGFEKTTGYSRDEALGQTPRLVKSGKQGAGFYKKLWDTILAGGVFSEVFVNRRKDGGLYYEEKTISPLKGPAGQVTHFVATGKDVTERMQTQERLQHMAQHDALTELPNRMLFLDRLKQALARARWHQRLVAVLFVDMDRFKTINDTLGHEIGDRLLQALAERFSASVREGDTVARFGGDEFVVLLDDVASEKDIGALAQKVIEMLAPPFEVDGQSLYITASIGVSMYPNDGEDSTTLIKNADIAMYRAKDLGKNTYQFYSADMSARAFERLTLESSLRHAIERNEFRLYYQPQIDAASGAVLGVEALLRWQHPDFGLVAPAEFIPLLEETGLIVPVGDWVFRTACEQLCAWHAAGWPRLRMAVNLSPRQFQAAGLAIMVERGLATVGCDPGLIELEITENVLLRHAAATLDTLDALRTLGVRLAIDDFGTGYSSLSYLRRYAIDTLKIDRSFVHDVPGDPDDSAIASAIIVMAQSLKLEVIAEGVETEAQRNFLQERGCQVMQGYLFNRPLPAEEIPRVLETRNPKG